MFKIVHRLEKYHFAIPLYDILFHWTQVGQKSADLLLSCTCLIPDRNRWWDGYSCRAASAELCWAWRGLQWRWPCPGLWGTGPAAGCTATWFSCTALALFDNKFIWSDFFKFIWGLGARKETFWTITMQIWDCVVIKCNISYRMLNHFNIKEKSKYSKNKTTNQPNFKSENDVKNCLKNPGIGKQFWQVTVVVNSHGFKNLLPHPIKTHIFWATVHWDKHGVCAEKIMYQ